MDCLLVISSHLDDAVLSAGQLIAGRPDTVVATVFAGSPSRPSPLTTYDQNCGFTSAQQAVTRRRREDRVALGLLGATHVHLDFLDHQYGEPADEKVIAARLGEVVAEHDAWALLGPLGLAHPDHHTVRRAYAGLVRGCPDLEAWVYEDLPARVLWPEQVGEGLAWWRGMGWEPTLGFFGTGPLEQKEEAVAAYRSQAWALSNHSYLVPERLHCLWPC